MARAGNFYNTTRGSGEVNANGIPYGFFASPLPGEPLGYPLLLSNGLPAQRAAQMMASLVDGSYLSPALTRRWVIELIEGQAGRHLTAGISRGMA